MGRPPQRHRHAEDRRSQPEALGQPAVSPLRLHERHRRVGRRPRAQGLDAAHDQPLAHTHAEGLPRVAGPRVARVLPRLEREALPPGRARPVQLRGRELHDGPVDQRGFHRLLRRPDGAPRHPVVARRVPRGTQQRHPRPADDTGTAGAVGHDLVVRHVDQAVPSRRELAKHRDQLLHEGRRRRLRARRAHPGADQRREVARRCAAARVPALLGAKGLHAGRLPQDGERGGGHRPDGVVREARRHDRRHRLHAGARLLRPALQAHGRPARRQGLAGRDDEERRWASRDFAGAPRHAGVHRRPERR